MIVGSKVQLRPIEVRDQAFIHSLNSDPVVRANVVGWDWPSSQHQQEEWFETNTSTSTHRWVVEDHGGDPLGLTGLWDVDWHNRNAMTALKLGGESPQRGRGLGTDAIMTVMAFAFYDVGLERLYSSILADNAASLKAYTERCGWSLEGTSRRHVWRHGQFKDLLQVGVLKGDFDRLDRATEYIERVTTRTVEAPAAVSAI